MGGVGTREMRSRKRVTLAQIAETLGLSTATVSLALRDSPAVAKATRERVQRSAKGLGYIYNRSAASLRTARTQIVGVAVHDVVNPYFAEFLSALDEALSMLDLTVLLCNHGDDFDRQQRFVETMMQYRCDGLILCPAVGTQAKDIRAIVDADVPFVMACREIDMPRITVIRGDDRRGIHLVTNHLIAQGHRRIAMVGGRRGSSPEAERHGGFCDALKEAGLRPDPALYFPDRMTRDDGTQVADAVLAERPTAIVCFNDLIAFGMINGLRRRGIEPGRDLAITGYDDIAEARTWTPALTSVWNGQQEVGRRAAAALVDAIEGRNTQPARQLITPVLHVRETSGPPKE